MSVPGDVRERWRAVAYVEKTHGRRGEVVAVPVHGLPPLLSHGLEVALVPPSLKGDRMQVIARCTSGGSGQLVSFDGVFDIGEAATMVGKTLLARVADLPDGWELRDADALVGRAVTDARLGPLGTIDSVMRSGAGDVWVVTGSRGETLVPAVPEIVGSVLDGEAIRVHIPVGLAPWDKV